MKSPRNQQCPGPFLFPMFLALFPLTVLVSLAEDLSFGAPSENVQMIGLRKEGVEVLL